MNRYHCVSFASLDEGAAFAAALSRFLCSPCGFARATSAKSSVEVIVTPSDDLRGLQVFLSTEALEAAAHAFGSPEVIASGGPELLPSTHVTIVSGANRVAYGKDDIVRRLTDAESDKRLPG